MKSLHSSHVLAVPVCRSAEDARACTAASFKLVASATARVFTPGAPSTTTVTCDSGSESPPSFTAPDLPSFMALKAETA